MANANAPTQSTTHRQRAASRFFPRELRRIIEADQFPNISWHRDSNDIIAVKEYQNDETYDQPYQALFGKPKTYQSFRRTMYNWGFKRAIKTTTCFFWEHSHGLFLRNNVTLQSSMGYKIHETPFFLQEFPVPQPIDNNVPIIRSIFDDDGVDHEDSLMNSNTIED